MDALVFTRHTEVAVGALTRCEGYGNHRVTVTTTLTIHTLIVSLPSTRVLTAIAGEVAWTLTRLMRGHHPSAVLALGLLTVAASE